MQSVQLGTAARGMALSVNELSKGQIRVALAGSVPVTRAASLLMLRWRPNDKNAVSVPRFTWAQINEGAVPVLLGKVPTGHRQYVPTVVQ